MKTYTYQEQYPDCYSLHRPDGTDFRFLQGDDARGFEEAMWTFKKLKVAPDFTSENVDEIINYFISQYDC